MPLYHIIATTGTTNTTITETIAAPVIAALAANSVFSGDFPLPTNTPLYEECLLAAGQVAVFAAAIEGLGTALLEVRGYSLQGHINLFSHRMMKVAPPVRSAVNKHRIAWSVLQWVVWSHRAVTGVRGGKRSLFVWAGRVVRRDVITL